MCTRFQQNSTNVWKPPECYKMEWCLTLLVNSVGLCFLSQKQFADLQMAKPCSCVERRLSCIINLIGNSFRRQKKRTCLDTTAVCGPVQRSVTTQILFRHLSLILN